MNETQITHKPSLTLCTVARTKPLPLELINERFCLVYLLGYVLFLASRGILFPKLGILMLKGMQSIRMRF